MSWEQSDSRPMAPQMGDQLAPSHGLRNYRLQTGAPRAAAQSGQIASRRRPWSAEFKPSILFCARLNSVLPYGQGKLGPFSACGNSSLLLRRCPISTWLARPGSLTI
ncbi:MAG: hypothetical protein IT427_17770 [Pirellulales bacterium]|nr:hypothetical protein [Pirellulales bacterium]